MLMMYLGRVSSSRRGTAVTGSGPRRVRCTSGRLGAVCRLRSITAACVDADLARLDFLRLRDAERQDTVDEGGIGTLTLHANGKLDASVEGAESPLAVQILVLRDLVIGRELATKGEVLTGDGDVDVLGLHPGKGGRDDDLVRRLVHIYRRVDAAAVRDGPPGQGAHERVLEEPVHRRAEGNHLVDGIEACDVCHWSVSFTRTSWNR